MRSSEALPPRTIRGSCGQPRWLRRMRAASGRTRRSPAESWRRIFARCWPSGARGFGSGWSRSACAFLFHARPASARRCPQPLYRISARGIRRISHRSFCAGIAFSPALTDGLRLFYSIPTTPAGKSSPSCAASACSRCSVFSHKDNPIAHLALPLGELPPQAAERAFAVTVYPLRLRCAQPPLPRGEAGALPLGSPSGRAVTAGD